MCQCQVDAPQVMFHPLFFSTTPYLYFKTCAPMQLLTIPHSSSQKTTPAYTVSTVLGAPTTYIRSAGTETLPGSITRGMLLPDTVTLPGVGEDKTRRVSQWLKDTKMAHGAYFLHDQSGKRAALGRGASFLTRHNDYGLALFATTRNMQHILAHRQPGTDSSKLTLVLSPGMGEFEAEIHTAFLFVEQKVRPRQKNRMDMGTAE
ncbi:hypothetical protein C8R44DRAFT_798139 [Mycena epipterygia]|nr:hypothetical protein C8R44DRAFT_798139 [Mycena epipterygia]